jgi:hypothetical protein
MHAYTMDVLSNCARSVHNKNEFRKTNFESILHEYIVRFKLVVFQICYLMHDFDVLILFFSFYIHTYLCIVV